MDHELQNLKDYLENMSDMEVLLLCLGFVNLTTLPPALRARAEDMVLICIDCEHWTNNTDEVRKKTLQIKQHID